MARQLMQKCTECGAYGLSTTCGECGGKAWAAGPMKWSPEDHQAARRRQLKGVENPDWARSLPTLDEEE